MRATVYPDHLAAINSVALAIGRFSSVNEMLEYALAKVLDVVKTDAGGVYLLDEERGELKMVVHRGLSEAAWRDFDHLKLGEGLSGRVALTGEPIVLRSLKDDPRLTRMVARDEGFRAFAAVPLRSSFKTYGTLNVHSHDDRVFSEEDVQLLTSMASQIGLAVANAHLFLDLRASERKFRGLVENAEDIIYLTDHDGRLTYANPAVERLLGHGPAQLVERRCAILSLVHPEDREMFASHLERMLGGETIRALEFRLRHADGERVRWMSQTNVPLRDEAGAPVGMQCIAHDVTVRREMQQQIDRAERLADLGRMAASIAHEIRNPLGAIVNSINVLRHAGVPANSRLLDIVSEEADRLNAIISEFLLFARPPAHAPIPCDLRELVDNTVMLFRSDAKLAQDVEVIARYADSLPPAYANPGPIRQVLWNLLSNAAEATAGGGRITIEVDPDQGPAGLEVVTTITDDGPGVSEPARVFEPFYTTRAQGTGLGLAVVARIVRDHGGTVTVRNCPGRGAQFTFTLPAWDGHRA